MLRNPSRHPVKGPNKSALSRTRRAGAPSATAKISASDGFRESALAMFFVFSLGGAVGKSTSQIVLRSISDS